MSAFLTPGGAAMHWSTTPKLDASPVRSQKIAWPKRHGCFWPLRVSANAIRTPTPIRQAALVVSDLPLLAGIVRDPNDDMILACVVAASASHVVSRDEDLLSLGNCAGIAILSPEAFLTLLRSAESSGS